MLGQNLSANKFLKIGIILNIFAHANYLEIIMMRAFKNSQIHGNQTTNSTKNNGSMKN